MAATTSIYGIPSLSNRQTSFGHGQSLFQGKRLHLFSFSNAGNKRPLSLRNRNSVSLQSCPALPIISNVPVVGPVFGFVTNPVFLLAVYLLGAFQFISGFSKTTFSDTLANRTGLAAIWPVLFLLSSKFRENFKKAVFR
eukprot:TRINITY_DN2961_c0_g1_i1.p1 TRINITY_DN2961_c0_g1~~TRINITY_DN2961_c0_g1_i1.p1  ORF type:complete len:139 (+),score=7.02 TRINITY_DN2961_c0_g1_i1:170-586(+)